jgi:hypothetical protein
MEAENSMHNTYTFSIAKGPLKAGYYFYTIENETQQWAKGRIVFRE